MSTTLTDAAISSFDDMVKQDYQPEGSLKGMFREKNSVVGSTHRFTRYTAGTATPRIPQTDVVPMSTGPVNATATLSDWNAPQYTDIFDQQKVNFQEQRLLAYTISSALRRREDQIILDAIDAASTSLTVSTNIGGTASNLNVSKLRDAKKELDAQSVPKTDRKFLGHSNNLYGLLGETEATSADYNTIRTLVAGEVDTFLGFKMCFIGDMDEGGIPIPSTRTCYAIHGGSMGCLGVAYGMDLRTEVNYIPEKTSWLANGFLIAGSVAIDANGIVEVSCTE